MLSMITLQVPFLLKTLFDFGILLRAPSYNLHRMNVGCEYSLFCSVFNDSVMELLLDASIGVGDLRGTAITNKIGYNCQHEFNSKSHKRTFGMSK